ncbi:hypothetical protein HDU77_008673 [Chytriomyces hyalinus]|nr:hypothetical protein HDU77_008673 [Chytriomyces hyalinus]
MSNDGEIMYRGNGREWDTSKPKESGMEIWAGFADQSMGTIGRSFPPNSFDHITKVERHRRVMTTAANGNIVVEEHDLFMQVTNNGSKKDRVSKTDNGNKTDGKTKKVIYEISLNTVAHGLTGDLNRNGSVNFANQYKGIATAHVSAQPPPSAYMNMTQLIGLLHLAQNFVPRLLRQGIRDYDDKHNLALSLN